jgi:hypothetical protein
MRVISVITEGAVIDQLLRHVRQKGAEHGDEPLPGGKEGVARRTGRRLPAGSPEAALRDPGEARIDVRV